LRPSFLEWFTHQAIPVAAVTFQLGVKPILNVTLKLTHYRESEPRREGSRARNG